MANGIRDNSIGALVVVDLQVIGLEFFHPSSKPFRVCCCCLQVLQAFMVSDNCGCGAVLYISFPETQGVFDSKQLFLLSRVIELRAFEFPSIKGDRVEQAIITTLQEHTTKGPFGGISFNPKRSMDIRLGKNWCLDQLLFQQLKGGLSASSPRNWLFLLLMQQLITSL